MGFFDRNRKDLEKKGYSPDRLPPGQYFTERFPVLQAGGVPLYKTLDSWDLRVFGLVERELVFDYKQLDEMATDEFVVDIHCVTKWSKFDTAWRGVNFSRILEMAAPAKDAQAVMFHGEFGYTANIPLKDLTTDEAMVALYYEGLPLEPEHGYPARFVFPRLYFWKSTKWLRGIEFIEEDRPGFWERNGYHMYGDPWQQQRYSDD
ncbi:Oxidoreductase molybdopterin binding domain-containing protein [Ferrithrix thermotolerans DSM 19514]|jgi:DMSO/TMAO reductase YedYZ molybdopterin-dependent catalytic subunit|uniref:Oxidoreductase molybdopterin binding domain-containing protein n=1 Tax=Ferrithrix thermotolerans DSM 19514 TaxID=1121881 RepID=A0A1M4U4F3_9ACTN|nr:sulfite oxidase-like oxidoreductase [Ferrithrix thermotolerans]SHE51618.1 Oxidoreductase molybdopterin binding domain-containing protein [Ferrithrix thermotolerans DSM 19514]